MSDATMSPETAAELENGEGVPAEAQPEVIEDGVPHPYHLVNPSIWPMLSSFAAGLMATGGVMFMHEATGGGAVLILGLLAVLTCMFFWWKDVIYEAVVEKAHTPIAKLGMRYGMALFIASEVMFFVAFFWAFFHSALFPTEAIGGVWPPVGIETVPAFGLPFLMTMILLLSGCTCTWAHAEIIRGRNDEAVKALAMTVGLGVLFTCVQVYEYGHVTYGFSENVFTSAFYMATGFHGFHVLVGTIFLLVCLFRAKAGHFTPDSHFGFEAAAWYWHFVDVVWLFLFVAIYWWGA
ncbi:MAG: cytochrome c oxidase subunit 3 [Alphaproteobacteria bacterium]